MADDAKGYVNTGAAVGSGERVQPIKINTTNLAQMVERGPGYVEQLVLSAPCQIDRMFGVKTGREADAILASAPPPGRVIEGEVKGTPVGSLFARGDVAYDTDRAKIVTIVKACVGVTKKGRAIHKVVSRSGGSWLQSERNLEKR